MQSKSSIHPYDLRCEYKVNYLGLGERSPRFSWKLHADGRDVRQSAYRLRVSTGNQELWDTGKVYSDQSVHVKYAGPALSSRTRYEIRVKVWNQHGQESDWSEAAYGETGLLEHDEWKASWMTAKYEQSEPCQLMRKSFTLDESIVSARLYATSLGVYRVYVNGEAADDTLFAPGWTSYSKRLQYQTYDVTMLLASGENTVGVILGNGWYMGNLGWNGLSQLYGNERAVLVQLHVQYNDGREEVIVSDDSWRASKSALLMSELYHGEYYDARFEWKGWNNKGFDDSEWTRVSLLDYGYDTLIAQEGEPVRMVEELQPVQVLCTPKGETVVDFGQNMVGWVQFAVEAEEGHTVVIRHAEVLDEDGNFYMSNLRTAKQTITYICRGEQIERYEPYFSFQGFRYIQVEGIQPELIASSVVAKVIHSDMDQTGTFECSDEMVNQLQRNIVWGQRGNFLDIPTDCPQRDERMGWTGDAQVFMRTAAFNMNVASFFTKWLKDLATDQLPDGGVPFVIPDVLRGRHSSAAWGDAAVICPWVLYERYGDKRVLEQQYESMVKWVEYIRSQGEQEHLWNTGFHFGDWLAMDAPNGSRVGSTPKDLIATAFYAYSAALLARTAAVLDKLEDAARYTELSERVTQAFRREFVTPNGRVASPTQTAYVLALMFDLLEEKDRPQAAAVLALYVEEQNIHLTTGFVGTPYLCLALSKHGYTDLAYKLVLQREYPSWLYPISKGATTIWEHWDGIKPDGSLCEDPMNSYNHYAYGSVGEWLYSIAAGLDTDVQNPGYKKARIAPHISEAISYARASYSSMYGVVASGWERLEDGRIQVKVVVPPNTGASVMLPGAAMDQVLESKVSVANAAGVHSVQQTDAGVQLEVGSGEYEFLYVLE
ncbi:family 78 glycoside hydrolase catalytic domain [Paenibacillus sp. NRS-1760]|uniref:family 78 glycoside hydrolase catalytic domain n=1 Tax=Paenibacillus sp. NRS-1760 TaxID=3233902 RepID=UPI003D2E4686